jgi:hypothetical protein
LVYFGTLGDGLLLQGRNKKPSRHKCIEIKYPHFRNPTV